MLLDQVDVVPSVNQVQLHPYFQQRDVRAFHAEHGILTQAWSPIGGITFRQEGSDQRSTLQDETIGRIAAAHSKTPAQVMLRWHPQQGRSAIPKSTKPHRIAENIDIFDFELNADELRDIDALDTGAAAGAEYSDELLPSFGSPSPRPRPLTPNGPGAAAPGPADFRAMAFALPSPTGRRSRALTRVTSPVRREALVD